MVAENENALSLSGNHELKLLKFAQTFGTSLTAMMDLSDRLKTFTDWPSQVPVKPKNLAEAGFYYVGTDQYDDTVCCFACKGKLNNWKAEDDPYEQHKRHFGGVCPFIRNNERDVLDEKLTKQSDGKIFPYDPIGNDDMENEEQRLRSFQRNKGWPGVVDPDRMAAAGFYFTGVDDIVKCFACDVSLRRWEAEDDPLEEHRRNQPHCPFLLKFSSREDVSTFYVGGSSKESTVFHNSRPNYTETVRITRNEHHPSTNGATAIHSSLTSPQSNHFPGGPTRSIYPMNLLHHSRELSTHKYSSEHARLHTFINWPKACPVQPKELIDAGFYFTGEGDKARCFECGITLASWEPEDTAWGEHEKWSKDCPLVKERTRRRNPHSPFSGDSRTQVMPQEQSWHSPNHAFSSDFVNLRRSLGHSEAGLSSATTNIYHSPVEQSEPVACQNTDFLKSKKGKEDGVVFHIQKAAQELVDRGYDFGTIEETIQHKTKVCKESINSVEELLDAVVAFKGCNIKNSTKQDELTATGQNADSYVLSNSQIPRIRKNPGTDRVDTHPVSEEGTGFSLSIDPDTLHRQVEKMQEAHMCKICLDAEIGVVFLPCGHLVCCSNCALEIQTKRSSICPVCRSHIESTIRTYMP